MLSAKNERGFTLVEITITLLMLTVVLGAAFSILNRFQKTYRYEEAYADAQRNARFAVARLNEVIRSAGTNPRAITTINPTNFAVLQAPTTTSGTAVSSASLQLRSDLDGDTQNLTRVTSNSDVIVTSENITLQHNTNTRQIILVDNTVSPAISTPIAENIARLKFTDPNGSTYTKKAIRVELTAVPSGINLGEPNYREVTYSATIRLRNR